MTSTRERSDAAAAGGSERAVQRKEIGGVGKHTLTQDLGSSEAGGGVGKHTLTEQVQRKLAGSVSAGEGSVAAAAEHGTSGSGGALPHAASIQRAFGHHDVSGIVAHTDGAASTGAQAMGAQAFATGNRVAFDGTPDLHTAAHEAAHVVQQRGGVSLKGGVGAEGDVYEQHADAVADQVVAGGSAAALLDRFAPGGGSGGGAAGGVQQKLGTGKAAGIKVRRVSTGHTGAIAGNPVWGKYPVRWDHDGKSTQVDPNDDDYEVVGGVGPTPTTTPQTTTPQTTTTTPTTGGKQPDRDISHYDDEEFQEQWQAKQDEVYEAMQAFVPKFQALDPAAEVRIRGSIATGVKANPSKVDPVSGKRLLFNPTDFDVDAYVASDKLYRAAIAAAGKSDGAAGGKIPGSKLPSVNAIIRQMRVALAKIGGNRDAPKALQFKFNVIIRSVRNDTYTIGQDKRDMGAPLTVEAETD